MNGEDYTYREHDGKCRYKESGVVGTPKSCTYVTPTNETALEAAVDKFGPVAISIDATQESFKIVIIKLPPFCQKINFLKETKDFMDYQFGIYEGGCSSDPKRANHGVLIVGYDERKINRKLKFYLNIVYVITV